MSLSPISDTLALTKLAFDLYEKGYLVARDAPKQFCELLEDLSLLKEVLWHIRNYINQENAPRGKAVDAVLSHLKRFSHILNGFGDLVSKYEKLASSDRTHILLRVLWLREQGAIKEYREKFGKHLQMLQIQLSILLTLSRGVQCMPHVAEDRKSMQDVSGDEESSFGSEGYLGRSWTLNSSNSNTLIAIKSGGGQSRQTRQKSPSISSENRSIFKLKRSQSSSANDNPIVTPLEYPEMLRGQNSWTSSDGLTSRNLSRDIGSDRPVYTFRCSCGCENSSNVDSADVRNSEDADNFLIETTSHGEFTGPTGLKDGSHSICKTKSFRQHIRQLSLPNGGKHNAPPKVHDTFLESYEAIRDEGPDPSWLRLSVWWLLKSRTISQALLESRTENPSHEPSVRYTSWDSTISIHQAYLDLMKSSWILEEVVLRKEEYEDLPEKEIIKMILELSRELHKDLHYYRSLHAHIHELNSHDLLEQNLSLRESFEQPIEAEDNVPHAIDDISSSERWITIDVEHGGLDKVEMIRFRTFVNAQLGNKREGLKSVNAPYMLLLWTRTGESEIFVSLVNQRRTVNLSRRMVIEDVETYMEQRSGKKEIFLKFPSQQAEIQFLSLKDIDEFLAYPKTFFAAVKERNPCSGELTIFQTVLSSYQRPNPQAHDRFTSFDSCELRVYESTSDECWKSTRRLVISSAADSLKLGCVSHWLPLDNIKLRVDENLVTLLWSDFRHLEEKSESSGDYDRSFSYVYKAKNPNNKILLDFSNSKEAQNFESCMLSLHETQQVKLLLKLEATSVHQEIRLYNIFDAEDANQDYYAFILAQKNPKAFQSEIYYIYRDLDFVIGKKPGLIDFRNLCGSHYYSTVRGLKVPPKENTNNPIPKFGEAIQIPKETRLSLKCQHELERLLQDLTGWRLKFSGRVPKLVLAKQSKHTDVAVQLWEKLGKDGRPKTHLTVRLHDGRDRWLTAPLFAGNHSPVMPVGFKLVLRDLSVRRGIYIDRKHLTAVPPLGNGIVDPTPLSKITFKFKDMDGKEEFLAQAGVAEIRPDDVTST